MIDWYIVATVDDGARIDDGVSPVAVLGPWSQFVASQKRDVLRLKHPSRQFEIKHQDDIEIDHANGRMRMRVDNNENAN